MKSNIDERLAGMSLEEKLGQMFMARGVDLFTGETLDLISRGLIGGIQAKSVNTADLIKQGTEAAPHTLFVGADMETGFAGTGFKGTPMPWQIAVGAVGSEEVAYQWAEIAALEARAYGLNWVFGPVVDIANEPANPYANLRCLSSDKQEVARLGAAITRAYQDNGLQVAAKHYPGAGRSPVDGHIEMMSVDCPREEFEDTELFVYKELIRRADLSGIMTGHICVPAVDGDRPATTSARLMSYLGKLGFKGLLITDSLTMKGVKSRIASKELFAQALAVGHDVILGDYTLPPSEQLGYMVDAARNATVSEQQIDRSVRKILRAKQRIESQKVRRSVDREAHRHAAQTISRRAVTLVGEQSALADLGNARMMIVVALEEEARPVGAEMASAEGGSSLPKLLAARFPNAEVVTIADTPLPHVIESTLERALPYSSVMFVGYALIHSYKGTGDFSRKLLALIGGLREKIRVFVTVGNPFAARELPDFPCHVFAFHGTFAEQALVEVLAGERQAEGRLPFSLARGAR